MRRHDPAVLLPSHTAPVLGQEAVRQALREYRDGIQWVRDSVVRTANAGADLDGVAQAAALPPHLAAVPALAERFVEILREIRICQQSSRFLIMMQSQL